MKALKFFVYIIQVVRSTLFPSITVLCGPPGSGKTMTLFSALRALPDMEVVGLNFSSATTPELLLKTFDHYCEYRKTPNGVVLAPVQVRLSELHP
jgi:ABC-type dipeptide/oligopeptide/nickel transport system ATPase component